MVLLRYFIILIAAVSITCGAYRGLHLEAGKLPARADDAAEVMYLPKGPGLKILSFGFNNMLSNLLWFNTINYFGKHYKSDARYKWFFHMCDLVTSLNPEAEHVYTFCATMLSWEAKSPLRSIALLDKAITYDPARWNYYFIRGFNHMYFMNDYTLALADFKKASDFEEAPQALLKTLSEKLEAKDPDSVIEVLKELLQSAEDPVQRTALEKRLREAILKRDLQRLQLAVKLYEDQRGEVPGSLNDLLESGIVEKIPARDPFGGVYYIDRESGQLRSSSRKGLNEDLQNHAATN